MSRVLENATILITGGTGSFGKQITLELLKYHVREIRIFSRGEDLQHQMARQFPDKRMQFIIGDVRDYERVFEAMNCVDFVFHAAALKQVPDCEFHPFEAVKTNIIGAHNVKIASSQQGVKKVISISTDKAVKPINAMGMTKALQEKILLSPEMKSQNGTVYAVVRYGNVIGSRGSVIPLFKEKVEKGEDLEVTSYQMTRFWLTLSDAVSLVFKALRDSKGGEIYVMKRPACLIKDLAEVMAGNRVHVVETGIRPGEKIHEVLVQEDEMRRAVEEEEFFTIYPHGTPWAPSLLSKLSEYTSENTKRLSFSEIAEILRKTGFI